MLTIYSLIIVLTFSIFGVVILNNYKANNIKTVETRLFLTANIVADTYKRNLNDVIFGRMMVRSYASQANARILIVDNEKNVVLDNFNTYMGSTLDNLEVRSSLGGSAKSTLYPSENGEILQLSVPITMNTGLESEIIGVVLVSSSMNGVNADVEDLRKDILRISSIALLCALILTAITATGLTKSLRVLTKGVEKISSGQLGYRIEKEEKGDIGKFINTFNDMSEKLSNIEKNRKSFINSISHELRTPLTSINALIDSLLMGNNSIDTYNEYLEDIRGESDRMKDLVNYLMGSIKLEDISLDISNENLGELLIDTIKFITPYADKNNVELNINIEENIIVKCDKSRVREVFLNIIENAIKYRDINKTNNYISLVMKKSKGKVSIVIEDNGIGIREESLAKIFNRGFRVLDNNLPSSTDIEGYGIGLSLVKSIITSHKWTISVASTLGIGTIFTINI